MLKKLVFAAAAVVAVFAAGLFAAPYAADWYARRKVDQTLARLRVDNTAVVNRGDVEVDLWTLTVTINDFEMIPPTPGYGLTIRRITISGPGERNRNTTANRVVAEGVRARTPSETTEVPSIEITNYSGPARGLSATPGTGARARTTDDNLAKVSFDSLSAPDIVTTAAKSGVRRTIKDVSVGRAAAGVIDAASVGSVVIDAPFLSPDEAPQAAAVSVAFGRISYSGFSLPALWRFYVGDGAPGVDKDREQLVKSVEVDGATANLELRPSGGVVAALGGLRIENLETRSLGYALSLIDPIALKARLGEALTPTELRQQLVLLVDAGRAVSFDRIAVSDAHVDAELGDGEKRVWRLASAEFGPYADWRLQSLKVSGLTLARDGAARLDVAQAEAVQMDATALAAYGDRVGSDKAMLTVKPTVEEFVRLTPRLRRVEATDFGASNEKGSLKAKALRIAVDAPLGDVPQKVAFRLDGLTAAPPAGSRVAELLKEAGVDSLDGSASFRLVLDASTKTLTLDRLYYHFEQLGNLTGQGEISQVDPTMALESGAAVIDKILALRLGKFRFFFKDEGAVDVLMRRAAGRAGEPADAFREQFARDAEETISRVFGPPARSSAESAAAFIRDPRIVEVTIDPKTPNQSLVEFIDAFKLGPEGVAQTIDVSILAKR